MTEKLRTLLLLPLALALLAACRLLRLASEMQDAWRLRQKMRRARRSRPKAPRP